jgi:glutamyl-tRNA reductase
VELIGKCELGSSPQTTPIILAGLAKDIRANVEALREAELRRHRVWLTELPDDRRAHVEALSRNIINSILRQMLSELRRAKDIERAAEVARRLFGNSVMLS